MQKEITVKITTNFGNEAIYPVCEDAKTFAAMVGTKTLTRAAIMQIKKLGYEVKVQHATL